MDVTLLRPEMGQVEGHAVVLPAVHGEADVGYVERLSTLLDGERDLVFGLLDGNDQDTALLLSAREQEGQYQKRKQSFQHGTGYFLFSIPQLSRKL